MTRPLSVAALLCAAALAACDKNAVQELPVAPLPGASIKFFNFGVNAPQVNFYANETKMTAVLSGTGQELTTGVAYGSAGNSGLYSAIAPATYTLTGRIAAATDKDLPIDNVSASLADGKSYSFYLSGFYDTVNKRVDGFVAEDPLPATIDYSVAYVRLVHAIGNANALTLYARLTGDTVTAHWAAIGGAVSYKGAGAFMTIVPGVYDLGTRYTDSTTNKITRTGVSLAGGRVYTIGARGDITVVSTTATNRPFLDNTANR
jgi:uncharacterized protein DUF4397